MSLNKGKIIDDVFDKIEEAYSGPLNQHLARVCQNIFNNFGEMLMEPYRYQVSDLCGFLFSKYRTGEITIGKGGNLQRGVGNVINPYIPMLGVMVAGNTRVNKSRTAPQDSYFGPGTFLKDCEIIDSQLDGVIIEGGMFTKINKSHIKEGTVFFGGAKVRDSVIGERNEIGQIEVVRSTTGELMKALHRGFIGDATLGNNINVSNFFSIMNSSPNGKKGIVRIGDNVFLGGASTVVSGENGIIIGDDAVIAAGATVLKDVPGGYIYISKDKMYPKDRNLEASK